MHGNLIDNSAHIAAGVVAQAPTHEEISRRAFELYEQRVEAGGSDLGDWLEAERQLLHERVRALDSVAPARHSD